MLQLEFFIYISKICCLKYDDTTRKELGEADCVIQLCRDFQDYCKEI